MNKLKFQRKSFNRVVMQRFCSVLACAVAITMPIAGHAAVTAKDIQVAGRVLGFTSDPLSGDVKVGIVYDPDNAISAQDEHALVTILGGGLTIGNIDLIPVPITIKQLATTSTDIIFLTEGVGAAAAKVGAQAAQEKIPCITTDLAATRAGFCAIGIQTDPKVQITINKVTATASDVYFTSAFMLMVTEI